VSLPRGNIIFLSVNQVRQGMVQQLNFPLKNGRRIDKLKGKLRAKKWRLKKKERISEKFF